MIYYKRKYREGNDKTKHSYIINKVLPSGNIDLISEKSKEYLEIDINEFCCAIIDEPYFKGIMCYLDYSDMNNDDIDLIKNIIIHIFKFSGKIN